VAVGTFFHPITLISDGIRRTIDALVDTGFTFTTMPAPLLRELGVQPFARARVKLANGQIELSDLGALTAEIEGLAARPIICAFGEPSSPPIIGAHTLEGFLLDVDPINQRLVPVDAWLA